MMNDLITRNHTDIGFINADDREEYNEWLNQINFCPIVESPKVEAIENQLNATIERQVKIAAKRGISLDQYREELADRRDSLMEDILFARNIDKIRNAR